MNTTKIVRKISAFSLFAIIILMSTGMQVVQAQGYLYAFNDTFEDAAGNNGLSGWAWKSGNSGTATVETSGESKVLHVSTTNAYACYDRTVKNKLGVMKFSLRFKTSNANVTQSLLTIVNTSSVEIGEVGCASNKIFIKNGSSAVPVYPANIDFLQNDTWTDLFIQVNTTTGQYAVSGQDNGYKMQNLYTGNAFNVDRLRVNVRSTAPSGIMLDFINQSFPNGYNLLCDTFEDVAGNSGLNGWAWSPRYSGTSEVVQDGTEQVLRIVAPSPTPNTTYADYDRNIPSNSGKVTFKIEFQISDLGVFRSLFTLVNANGDIIGEIGCCNTGNKMFIKDGSFSTPINPTNVADITYDEWKTLYIDVDTSTGKYGMMWDTPSGYQYQNLISGRSWNLSKFRVSARSTAAAGIKINYFDANIPLSSDSSLSDIIVDGVSFPNFNSTKYSYIKTLTVGQVAPVSVDQIVATATDGGADIQKNIYKYGDNTIVTIKVRALDNKSKSLYSIHYIETKAAFSVQYSVNGTIISDKATLKIGDVLNVSANITDLPISHGENFILITAVYKGNKLGQIFLSTNAFAGSNMSLSNNFTMNSNMSECNIKTFLFKDINTIIPHTKQQGLLKTMAEYYVDPLNGNDNNSGTINSPFLTIEKAKSVVRGISSNMTGDINVWLRGGEYLLDYTTTTQNVVNRSTNSIADSFSWRESKLNFDANDSGTNGYSIKYQAYGAESPVISGGNKIDNWTLYDSNKNIYRAPISSSVRGRQLYVNGVAATIARSNEGWLKMDSVASGTHTVLSSNPDYSKAQDMVSWGNKSDITFVYLYSFTTHRIKVNNITQQSGLVSISMNNPGWDYGANILQDKFKYPWYIENAYELIDTDGEFYLDKTNNYIYYKPRAGENMSAANARVPVVDSLMTFNGSKNIQLKGITFGYTSWLRPDTKAGFISSQDAHIREPVTGVSINDKSMPAAITVSNSQSIRFEGCLFANMGAIGLAINDGSKDNVVIGNKFYNISGNGVKIGSPEWRYPYYEDTNWLPLNARYRLINNDIANNYFDQVGREFEAACPISVMFAEESDITNNEIYNAPYSAMTVGYGWSAIPTSYSSDLNISNNKVFGFMQKLFDGGGIYTNGPTRGGGSSQNYNIVSGNCFKLAPLPNHTFGVNYMNEALALTGDDWTSYNAVYHDSGSSYWYDNNTVAGGGAVAQEGQLGTQMRYIITANWDYKNIGDKTTENLKATNSYLVTTWGANPKSDSKLSNAAYNIYFDTNISKTESQAQPLIDAAGITPQYSAIRYKILN